MTLLQQQKNLMSVRKDSLTSSHAYRMCCKHPEKVATHQLLSKNAIPDAFYCEKCSIMLASQGYNVMKLASLHNMMGKKDSISSRNSRASSCRQGAMPSNRKSQISSFTQSLHGIHQQLCQKLNFIQEYLIKSQNQHGRIIEQANKFYNQVQEIIELQKYTTYNSILNRRLSQENRVRQIRDIFLRAYEDTEAIMDDIRENMDAVETVDYSIYNAIMGGYMVKLEGIHNVAKSSLPIKQVQPYELILPEIPKFILTLGSKIEIIQKKHPASMSNSVHNSFNTSTYKPPRAITEDDQVVCISEQSSNQEERPNQYIKTKIGMRQEKERTVERSQYEYDEDQQQSSIQSSLRDKVIGSDCSKQNKGDQMNNTKKMEEDVVIKQIIRSRNQFAEMAFSFDEQSHNQKQLRLREREDSNLLEGSNLLTMRGFEDGKLSKIQERLTNKEVCESRESLGEYLGISHSREGSHFQDTETLLIA